MILICHQKDPSGWVPFCGQNYTPGDWPICPHPSTQMHQCPTHDEHYKAAWAAGWRPPDFTHSPVVFAISAKAMLPVVAQMLDCDVADLIGKSRNQPIVWYRQVAMAVIRTVSGSSYPELGRVFGGRDHTTAMHAVARVKVVPRLDRMTKEVIAKIMPLEPYIEADAWRNTG